MTYNLSQDVCTNYKLLNQLLLYLYFIESIRFRSPVLRKLVLLMRKKKRRPQIDVDAPLLTHGSPNREIEQIDVVSLVDYSSNVKQKKCQC